MLYKFLIIMILTIGAQASTSTLEQIEQELSDKDQMIINIALKIVNSHRDNTPRRDNVNSYLHAIGSFFPPIQQRPYQKQNINTATEQLLESLQQAIENRINEEEFSASDLVFKLLLSEEGKKQFKEGRTIIMDSLITYKKKQEQSNQSYSYNRYSNSSSSNNSNANNNPQSLIEFSDDDLAILLIQMLNNPKAVIGLIDAPSSTYSNYNNNSYNNYGGHSSSSSYGNNNRTNSNYYGNNYNQNTYNRNSYDQNNRSNLFYNEGERKKIIDEQNKIIESFLSVIPKNTSFWQKLSNFQTKFKRDVEHASPLPKVMEIIITFLTPGGREVFYKKLELLHGKDFVNMINNPTYKKWQEFLTTIKPQKPVLPWTETSKDAPEKGKDKKNALKDAQSDIKNHIAKTKDAAVNQVKDAAKEKITGAVNDLLGGILGNNGGTQSSAGGAAVGDILGGLLK